MKFLVPFLLSYLLSIFLIAQDIKSPWETWNNTSLEDSVRLRALCIISDNLLENYPDSSNSLADRILNRTVRDDLIPIKAEALRIKGEYYEKLYEYEQALSYYQSSLSIFKDLKAQPAMINLYYLINAHFSLI